MPGIVIGAAGTSCSIRPYLRFARECRREKAWVAQISHGNYLPAGQWGNLQ